MRAQPRKIRTEREAADFMKSVKFALRYGSSARLPLASMFSAAGDKRRAIELTNALLASAEVVETNIVADRIVLVHRDVVPALYALRTRFRKGKLSGNAERAFQLILKNGTATSGDVRRHLGFAGLKRPDPGDLALAELQREMLIDRGPSSVPEKGIPYLSKEGFPYRIFEKAHPELVSASRNLTIPDAIAVVLQAAGAVPSKKLASMFKLCLTEEEISPR